MKIYKTTLWLALSLFLLLGQSLHAQDEIKLVLKDSETHEGIEGAFYQYGGQSGITMKNGLISLTKIEGGFLELSHINYGQWRLAGIALKTAFEKGEIYKKMITVSLQPVTVIAVKHGQPSNDEMRLSYQENMAHDAGAVLKADPIVGTIKKSAAYGFDPVIRGFKYDQINVVLDGGLGAIAACPNRMDPPTSQMAPNMVDRIEILKGPYALRFGNGLGATVNFKSAKANFKANQKAYGRLSTGYESNGNIFRTEAMGGFSADRTNIELFGSWSEGKDYTTGNDQNVPAQFNRGSAGIKLSQKVTANQTVKVSAVRNFARDTDFPALPMDLIYDDTWLLNASHEIALDGKLTNWQTALFGSFVDHKMSNELKQLNPRMVDATTLANTAYYGGRTEATINTNGGRMYAGADIRKETADGTRTRSFLMGPNAGQTMTDNVWQDGQITKTSIFTEYQFGDETFEYVVSARIEMNNARSNNVDGDFGALYPKTNENQVNPGISGGIIRDLDQGKSLSLWLGRTQRSGSLTERFINFLPVGQDPYEIVGNPNLKPEVNNQADFIFRSASANTMFNFNLFGSLMQDYIVGRINPDLAPKMPMSPGVRQMQNLESAFKTGFEISWNQKITGFLSHQMGIAYTYAKDLDSKEPLPEIAPLDMRYTLKGTFLEEKLIPSISFRAVTEQNRISPEFGETETPGFTTLDLRLDYSLSKMINLSLGVDNLFNENYYEHLNRSVRGMAGPIFERGRNAYLNLNLKF